MASYHADTVLKEFHSAVLEGASQVHARAVPWQLAEGRIYAIQSRYTFPITRLNLLISHKHIAGARACLGRRCELL